MTLRSCENCVHANTCYYYKTYGMPIPITFARTCNDYVRAHTKDKWLK